MSDEITLEQKKELVVKALGLAGFEQVGDMDIYTKEHGLMKIVVDLTAGTSVYFSNQDKIKIDDDDDAGTLAKLDTMILEAEDGRMPTNTTPDMHYVKNTESLSDDDPAKITPEMLNTQTDEKDTSADDIDAPENEMVDYENRAPKKRQLPPPAEAVELTIDIVKKYINEKVTDEEAYKFIQLCKARQLNPFLGQVHLIKPEFTGTAKMVVGKEGFMERAERDPNYNGFEAGIIVMTKEKITIDLPGAFHTTDETLIGGWAKVYRTDRSHPIEARVLLKEYDTGKASWARMKATMIRKVPIVQAHREAFPSELSGMYDQSEAGVEVAT